MRVAAIPEGSTVARGFGEVHFCDTYQIAVQTDKSAAEILRELMRLPRWAGWLMSVRNAIVGLFGLKAGRSDAYFPVLWETESEPANGSEGSLPMVAQTPSELVTGLSDRHLDFRVSILKDPAAGTVSLTTIVHFNNLWGRLYFLPVRPFHKLLVKTLLRNYLRKTRD
jgi:hypothetical protein